MKYPESILPNQKYSKVLTGILCLFLFIFSINLMGDSFKHLSSEIVYSFDLASVNPFIALFIGLLITALLQSSSTSTAIIITAVGTGSISFQNAVPMILGANIGTTITSTIISLGFIDHRKRFRKAFSAGIVHDIYNILIVCCLFPLELKYGFLSKITAMLSALIIDNPGEISKNYDYKLIEIGQITGALIDFLGSIISLLISLILLFVSIRVISRLIFNSIIGDSQQRLRLYLFKNPFKSFSWGLLTTGVIQSSSITTSLVVPLAAMGKVKLNKIAPFIYGANVGTTITAFITVAFNSYTVLNIAILHLIINLFGALFFMPFAPIRNLPVFLANYLSYFIVQRRVLVVVYILIIFFIIPFTLISIF